MKISDLPILEYLVELYPGEDVRIVARDYDSGKVKKWAVVQGSTSLSKSNLDFMYEPLPSNRSKDFLKDHRFRTAQSALNCYLRFENKHNKILLKKIKDMHSAVKTTLALTKARVK